ncbi:MAG: DNA repair protein RecN [Bacteroidales bacterium]|nr:DNA repair protein RecN [Bacteroidales bacterium]
MLQLLSISNYTIIPSLSIRFGEGFSVITGETGAGKSILLGALSLVLGQRADTSVLGDKTKKSVVEAVFRIKNYGWEDFFTENDIDYDEECLLRREITPQGKSRAFINDTPVPLNVLRQLAERLVDIHSQHANLLLRDKHFQLRLIDQFAHLQKETETYRTHYGEYLRLQQQYHKLQTDKPLQDTDYLSFLLQELEQARLQQGEQQALEEEMESLQHAEEIKQELYTSHQQLSGGDQNLVLNMQNIQRQLQHAAKHKASLQVLAERMQSICIDTEDLSREIQREEEKTACSPERADTVRERLDLLYGLQQKHKVRDEAGLIEKQQELQGLLQGAADAEAEAESLRKAIAAKEKELSSLAGALHQKREAALPEMQQAVVGQLQRMNMPHVRTLVRLETVPFGENGCDEAEFLFSANAGTPPQPLSKIASGGEISRIMLALKALISQKNILPTILFDEIDNGVSGEVSSKMGDVMRNIARYSQVIAITHQAQIAAKAPQHYLVYKETADGHTRSDIRRLNEAESLSEIAQMLGDGKVTPSSLQMAETLRKA